MVFPWFTRREHRKSTSNGTTHNGPFGLLRGETTPQGLSQGCEEDASADDGSSELSGTVDGKHIYPLVITNIAMENDPFIDNFPSYKPPFIVDFPWLC